jgi:hypothetical protein
MKAMSVWIRSSFKTLWGKFLWYFLANTALSLVFGLLLFWSFGNEIHFTGNALEKEYFDAVCGVFAIIGLGIAIFQLAALKREEDVIAETTRNIHIRRFIFESREPINQAIALITELKSLIINDDLNPVTVKGFQNKVSASLSLLHRIDSEQDSMECDTIINCKNGVTLLEELQILFLQVVTENDYVVSKQGWVVIVDKLLKGLQECLAKLKK